MVTSTIWAPKGEQGDKGPTGDQGPVGDKGPQGDPGAGAEDFALFKSQILNNTDPTLGINLPGFIRATGAASRTARQKIMEMAVTPDDYGAVGDGVVSDNTAILAAISTGLPVRGAPGKTYGVTGNLNLSGNLDLSTIKFKQLTPGGATNRRTINYAGTGSVNLYKVTIDRNGNGLGGALNDAAGIYISGATSGVIEKCEVFGNDFGNGIAVIGSQIDVLYNYVHDITGGTSSSAVITDDSVQGIWCYLSSGRFIGNRVKNLYNIWTGQAQWTRFTRGMAFGGCSYFVSAFNYVQNVDQGFDFSGGDNNRYFIHTGCNADSVYSYGHKFANTCTDGVVTDCLSFRAGLMGFVFSAPTSNIGVPLNTITRDILVNNCQSIDSGYGGNWDTFSGIGPCGFAMLTNPTDYAGYPTGIIVQNCRASGPSNKMKYGYYSNAVIGQFHTNWNVFRNNKAVDYLVQAASGNAFPYVKRSNTSSQALTINTDNAINFNVTLDDKGSMISDSSNCICRRAGIYIVTATVRYSGSATDVRTTRILINGTAASVSEGVNVSPGNASFTRYSVSLITPLNVGDTIRVTANPNSATGITVPEAGLTIAEIPGLFM